MVQMKSYIVVMVSLFAAFSANAQTLDVSYRQKHTTVQVLELLHTDVSAKGHDGVAHNFARVPMKAVLATVQALPVRTCVELECRWS